MSDERWGKGVLRTRCGAEREILVPWPSPWAWYVPLRSFGGRGLFSFGTDKIEEARMPCRVFILSYWIEKIDGTRVAEYDEYEDRT